jgi:hypothetical protein
MLTCLSLSQGMVLRSLARVGAPTIRRQPVRAFLAPRHYSFCSAGGVQINEEYSSGDVRPEVGVDDEGSPAIKYTSTNISHIYYTPPELPGCDQTIKASDFVYNRRPWTHNNPYVSTRMHCVHSPCVCACLYVYFHLVRPCNTHHKHTHSHTHARRYGQVQEQSLHNVYRTKYIGEDNSLMHAGGVWFLKDLTHSKLDPDRPRDIAHALALEETLATRIMYRYE